MNKISLSYIVKTEFNELFNNDNKIYRYSLILTLPLWLVIFISNKDDFGVLKDIIQMLLEINSNLLGVSIGYVIFVVTMVFTGWSKTKLMKIYHNNEQLFIQIFSPYIVGSFFIALNVFWCFLFRYSIFEKRVSVTINEVEIDVYFYAIVVFILFFGTIHSVLFLLHTLVWFIKDMTSYTKIENENLQEAKSESLTYLFKKYVGETELFLETIAKENQHLRERIEELEKKIT